LAAVAAVAVAAVAAVAAAAAVAVAVAAAATAATGLLPELLHREPAKGCETNSNAHEKAKGGLGRKAKRARRRRRRVHPVAAIVRALRMRASKRKMKTLVAERAIRPALPGGCR
jgi:hypothetical protein